MKPIVDIDALKVFLESILKDKIAKIDLIQQCSRPENFAVLTVSGARYAVKCCEATPKNLQRLEAMVAHLEELERLGAKAIRLVASPVEFQDKYRILVTSWCPGVRVLPNKLSCAQLDNLIKTFLSFAEALQKTTHIRPIRDSFEMKCQLVAKLGTEDFNKVFRSIEPWLSEENLAYRPEDLKIIHGDLHHGNFYWQGGEISAFMDLEEFRYGYTTDDWIRYITCAAEHTLWYDFAANKRILALYERMLPHLPAHQWHTAINGALIRKASRRLNKVSNRWWYCLNLRFRLGFYRRLHELVDQQSGGSTDV